MKRIALAVDLGASSLRLAQGELENGELAYRLIRQVVNEPRLSQGRLRWDFAAITRFVDDAIAHGQSVRGESGAEVSLGIDSWGVDVGFIRPDGTLVEGPIAYRDAAVAETAESLVAHRWTLFQETGIAYQPFNTVYQLATAVRKSPGLREVADWRMIPELLIDHLLPGRGGHEVTNASTTQLVGLNGEWSELAFGIAGWPVPRCSPMRPGEAIGTVDGIAIVRVASHDTASAVYGMGELQESEAFLNLGSWGLLGTNLDQPIVTQEAYDAGLTNERGHDGRVRFLKNIPGFAILNRLHQELEIALPVREWLATGGLADSPHVSFFDPRLYNPESMRLALRSLLRCEPTGPAEWASVGLASLVWAVDRTMRELSSVTGRPMHSIRLGGGGSQCQPLIDRLRGMGWQVSLAPVEATIVGNLLMQLRSPHEAHS